MRVGALRAQCRDGGDDERSYLFHLAGEPPGLPSGPPQEVPQGVLHLLDRLDDTPAYVLDAKYDVLAWNAMAVALVVDFAALPPKGRNAIRWFFEDPASSTIALRLLRVVGTQDLTTGAPGVAP